MSADVTRTWAGSPSRIATRDGPWDSPAVSQRNVTCLSLSAVQGGHDGLSEDDAREGAHEHERAERVVPAPGHQGEQSADDAAEQYAAPDAHQQLLPAEPAEGQPEHSREPDVAVTQPAWVDEPEQEEHP